MLESYTLEKLNQAKLQDIHRNTAKNHLVKMAQTDKPSLFAQTGKRIANFISKVNEHDKLAPVIDRDSEPEKSQTQEIPI